MMFAQVKRAEGETALACINEINIDVTPFISCSLPFSKHFVSIEIYLLHIHDKHCLF